jgi:hypothetical protein
MKHLRPVFRVARRLFYALMIAPFVSLALRGQRLHELWETPAINCPNLRPELKTGKKVV